MGHLSDGDLVQRASGIFFNRAVGAKVDALSNPPPTGWEHLWRDVVDEAYRRFGDMGGAAFVDRIATQFNADNLVRRRLSDERTAAFLQHVEAGSEFLVRYSKRKYLEELVARGHVEVRPASAYNDPSLNASVRDDELRLAIRPNPSEIKLEVMDRHTGKCKGLLQPIDSRITSVAPSDYYVYCMSGWFSPYLIHDFDADGCVVIREPKVSVGRLDGLNSQLPFPAGGGDIEKVMYVDPLNTGLRQFRVYYAKHFRYAYQRERRVV